MNIKFAFVILHYGNPDVTIRAIETIRENIRNSDYRVVVVDNASPNQSGLYLKELYGQNSKVHIVLNPVNEGFAKGNNVGYRYAREKLNAEYIIVMNNDVWISQPDFLQKISDIYKRERFDVLGPDILAPDGSQRNPHRMDTFSSKDLKRIIRNRTIILFYLKLKKILKLEKKIMFIEKWDDRRSAEEREGVSRNIIQRNVVLQGSCLIFSPDYIKKEKNAFCPDTFMWMEEEILTWLCRQKKYAILYDPSIQVVHEEEVSTKQEVHETERYRFFSEQLKKSAKVFLNLMDSSKVYNENKLLIICPSMWPRMNSWGETQRMYYLANHLSLHGWEVFTCSPGYASGGKSVDREQLYRSFFKGIYQAAVLDATQQLQSESPLTFGERLYKRVTRLLIPIVNWFYNEPNCTEGLKKQFWIFKYKKEILQLLREERIEKVLISVPPFALMGMGKIVKRKYPQIKLVYDYRDPWYLWNKKKNFAWFSERRNLTYADWIVGFSEIFSRELESEFHLSEKKIQTIYNGYSEADWEAYETQSKEEVKIDSKLCLVYTGMITLANDKDNFRNVNMLINAVKQLSDVELYLVGVNDYHAGTKEGNIHFVGNVSQQESFRYMKTADVLLSIHDTIDCSGKYLISGKFYDYMRSGRVIWHIGAKDSLMSQWVHEYKLGVACCNEQKDLQNTLLFLREHWERGTLETLRECSQITIQEFSREYQNTKYESFLRSIDK